MHIGTTTATRRFYLTDPHGSVVGLTLTTGALVPGILQAGMDGGVFPQSLVASEPGHGALASSEWLM